MLDPFLISAPASILENGDASVCSRQFTSCLTDYAWRQYSYVLQSVLKFEMIWPRSLLFHCLALFKTLRVRHVCRSEALLTTNMKSFAVFATLLATVIMAVPVNDQQNAGAV